MSTELLGGALYAMMSIPLTLYVMKKFRVEDFSDNEDFFVYLILSYGCMLFLAAHLAVSVAARLTQ